MRGRFSEALPALLFLAAFLAFWRGTLEVPFQLDDEDLIEYSDVVRRPPSLFGTLVSALKTPFGRPLATFTLQADHALWGLDARGFHVTALALHLGCVWLVWLLVRRGVEALWADGASRTAAWVAAGIFAFHPVQTETVAYLAARSTLLSVFLGLGGILCADAACLAAGRGEPWKGRAAGALSLFLASVASMPLGLAFPAVLAAWLAFVRRVPRRALGLAAAAGGLIAAFVAGDLAHFFSRGAVFRPPGYGPAYWMTQPECLLRGVGKILVPRALTLDYDIMPVGVGFVPGGAVPAPGLADGKVVLPFEGAPGSEGSPEGVVFSREKAPGTGMKPRFSPASFDAVFLGVRAAARDVRFWGPCLTVLAAGTCAFLWARRRLRRGDAASARAAAFGAALFLMGWLPAAGAPLEDLFFEHHLYLSMAGVAWGGGLLAARFSGRGATARLPAWPTPAAFLFLAWGLMAAHRVGTWSRKDAIWADSVRASPGKPRPRFNLATMWHETRRGPPERLRQMCVNASIAHVRFRDNANLLAEIPNLLGGIHQWMRQYDLAHFFFQDAVRRMPVSRAFRSNLAGNARCLDRHEEAAALYAGLLREHPGDPSFLTLLAEELAALGRLAEAREILERLLVAHPAHHAAAVDLAAVLVQQGDLDAAVGLYRAVSGRYRSAPLLYNLATAFLRGGRTAEAREALFAALAIEPSFAPAHAALAQMAGAPPAAPQAPR